VLHYREKSAGSAALTMITGAAAGRDAPDVWFAHLPTRGKPRPGLAKRCKLPLF
jgi:hypothetical protein